jgi:hypothetical protein
MNSQSTERKLPRILTMAALACFALPFLTVTCYGDSTVSGVQAATEIDIYPGDSPGERELFRNESANGFAFLALVATAASLALALASAHLRLAAVWAAAVGVIALAGLFVYAFYRSYGEAWPRIGFVGALVLLVGAAWAGAGRVPRWVVWVIGGVAVSMIPGAVVRIEEVAESPVYFGPVYIGAFVAVALAVGAMWATVRRTGADPGSRPSAIRVVGAGIVGLACVTAAAVGGPSLMGLVLSREYGSQDVAVTYTFAIAVLAISVASSVVAWVAGRAIVHGRRRRTAFAPLRTEVGA